MQSCTLHARSIAASRNPILLLLTPRKRQITTTWICCLSSCSQPDKQDSKPDNQQTSQQVRQPASQPTSQQGSQQAKQQQPGGRGAGGRGEALRYISATVPQASWSVHRVIHPMVLGGMFKGPPPRFHLHAPACMTFLPARVTF